jgi:thiosulfate dehydrogenase (quinone) large subunit
VSAGATGRREVLSKGVLAGAAAALVLVTGGIVAGLGRLIGGAPASAGAANTLGGGTSPPTTAGTTTTAAGGGGATTTTGATPSGTAVGPASSVPVGGSATFTDPSSGDPALVVQQTAGKFHAFDAVCPHAGCTVAYAASGQVIACPCHGSEFDPTTGAVLRGPAPNGLTVIKMVEGPNGDLYVQR